MATRRGFIPGYIGSPPVVHTGPTEAERLANIQAIGERERRLQEQKAAIEEAKLKAQAASEAARKAAAFSLHQSQTNAAWNMMLAKAANAAKKPTISLEEETPLGKVKRTLTADQFEHEKALKDYASKLDALNAERAKSAGAFFPWSGGRQVSAIDKDIAALEPPQDLISGPADMGYPAAQSQPAQLINTQSPVRFNGTTSMTGPGFAPVQSRGFIGTPGGENAFVDPKDDILAEEADVPEDLVAPTAKAKKRLKYNPETGDFE